MGAEEVQAFLSHVAIHAQETASTWDVTLHALLFSYRSVRTQQYQHDHDLYTRATAWRQRMRSPLDGR
jgi:hypothetical protein